MRTPKQKDRPVRLEATRLNKKPVSKLHKLQNNYAFTVAVTLSYCSAKKLVIAFEVISSHV